MLARTLLFAALAFAVLAGPARATEFDWSPAGQLGLSRYGAAAARLPDGRVLVVGGKDHWSHPPAAAAELYDPAKNAWTPAPPMRTARSYPSAVTLKDGRVLVAGGEEDASKTSAEIFDPAARTWTPAASSTSDQVFAPAVMLADGRVLAVGGEDEPAAELYNPATDTWTLVAAPHYIYESAGAVTLPDGRVLVAGGWQPAVMDPLGYTARRAAEIFDPATGAWTLTGELNQRRSGAALILLAGGQPAYVGGAFGRIEHNVILESVVLSTAEIYDVASGTWKELPKQLKPAATIAIALRCSGGPCHDRLVLRGRGRTLAQRDVTVAAPKTITVRLRLSTAARRALRHRTTPVTIRLQHQGTSVKASLRA